MKNPLSKSNIQRPPPQSILAQNLPQPLKNLPPQSLAWAITASTAAAISYADRGTSAIAASSLLDELHWTESQLGEVQSAFFVGYALTQVFGGILGGKGDDSVLGGAGPELTVGSDSGGIESRNLRKVERKPTKPHEFSKRGGFRSILPVSLFFTGICTLAFPLAATLGGPSWASLDRFCLGLMEGLLLPAAMSGVSATTSITSFDINAESERALSTKNNGSVRSKNENKATASSIVIAGCYIGSAWAYLSAWFLFSDVLRSHLLQLSNNWGVGGSEVSTWPFVFYVNGILSMGFLWIFREQFVLPDFSFSSESALDVKPNPSQKENILKGSIPEKNDFDLWKDSLDIAKDTLSSNSGRAIIAAQVGQGTLLYTISSWGPLYLERISRSNVGWNPESLDRETSPSSSVAVAASEAASSLVLPQLVQAFVGVLIGSAADQLSSKIGTRSTRRALQIVSGVGPAIILCYLSVFGVNVGDSERSTHFPFQSLPLSQSPTLLFGAAQIISALSLGAVSVSHLDIAAPDKAGAVYALGNVAAAASGSLMVNLFGRWLESENAASFENDGDDLAKTIVSGVSGREFDVPFRVVAFVSALGSLVYGFTVDTKLEIGGRKTFVDKNDKNKESNKK